jgi:hypothetical protein
MDQRPGKTSVKRRKNQSGNRFGTGLEKTGFCKEKTVDKSTRRPYNILRVIL